MNELKITYTSNKYIGKYNYDILFENKRILEIQGDFWHGNPNKYKENDILFGSKTAKMIWDKDLKKKNFVEKRGFKIFYLWETNINKMTDEEIIKIFSTGEKVEKTPRGAKPITNTNNSSNKKVKKNKK